MRSMTGDVSKVRSLIHLRRHWVGVMGGTSGSACTHLKVLIKSDDSVQNRLLQAIFAHLDTMPQAETSETHGWVKTVPLAVVLHTGTWSKSFLDTLPFCPSSPLNSSARAVRTRNQENSRWTVQNSKNRFGIVPVRRDRGQDKFRVPSGFRASWWSRVSMQIYIFHCAASDTARFPPFSGSFQQSTPGRSLAHNTRSDATSEGMRRNGELNFFLKKLDFKTYVHLPLCCLGHY